MESQKSEGKSEVERRKSEVTGGNLELEVGIRCSEGNKSEVRGPKSELRGDTQEFGGGTQKIEVISL